MGRGDVEEVVRPRVDELELPEAVLDRRGVQHLWLLATGRATRASTSVSLLGAFTVRWLAPARLRMLQNWLTGPWPVTWSQTRDARAGLEDALGVEQRHAVLVGLGAERQAGVVVRRWDRRMRLPQSASSAAQPSATPAASRRGRRVSRFMIDESPLGVVIGCDMPSTPVVVEVELRVVEPVSVASPNGTSARRRRAARAGGCAPRLRGRALCRPRSRGNGHRGP